MPLKSKKSLSHAEIWDDSALQDAWNDAYGEYKRYHSIAARGEDPSDILREAELQDTLQNGQDVPQEPDRDHDMTKTQVDASEGGEPVPVAMRDEASVAEEDKSQGPSHLVEDSPTVPGATSTKSEPLAQMPHALIGGGQDDALKNLMMSWYYAGYYTGLREGQQQAHVGSTTASHR